MERNEFLKILKNNVSQMLGSQYEYQLRERYINNGVKSDVITISRIGESYGKTFAIVYDGADGYDEIYNKAWYIADDFESSAELNMEENINKFLDWEVSKDLVAFSLVNYKANEEWLEHMPHVVLSDLAMVFYISVKAEDGMMTTWVDNSLIETWKIDANELPEIARKNTMRLYPAIMCSLDNMAGGLGIKVHTDDLRTGSFILSNEMFNRGAAVIFYNGLLKSIADMMESDLVLIPSSIHEMLFLKKSEEIDYEQMQCLIIDINKNVLELEDVLSNNLYVYSREDDEITQVTECDLEIKEDLF